MSTPWLCELARLAAQAQLAIPTQREAGALTPTSTADARILAQRSKRRTADDHSNLDAA